MERTKQTITLDKDLIKQVLIRATELNGGLTPKTISASFELVFKGVDHE